CLTAMLAKNRFWSRVCLGGHARETKRGTTSNPQYFATWDRNRRDETVKFFPRFAQPQITAVGEVAMLPSDFRSDEVAGSRSRRDWLTLAPTRLLSPCSLPSRQSASAACRRTAGL